MGIIKLNDKDFSGISMDIATNLDENSTDTQAASAKAVYEKLKKVNADTVDGWHIYSGLTEIGLSGSVTMTDVITAMPNKSELRFTNNTTNPNYVSDVPDKYGFLIIKKNLYAEATWIAVNRKTAVPMYFGSWHSDNGWTGWSSSDSSHLSNENLLDNPDFSINQRKKTEYTENGYAVDRWQLSGATDGSFTVDTKTLKCGENANYVILRQFVDSPQRFANRTVTVTVKAKNITGNWSATLWHYDGTTDVKLGVMDGTTNDTILTFTAQIPENILSLRLNIGVLKSSEVELEWAKMEIGSVTTPFVPPHPATEWSKCQRYYQDLGGCPIFGVAVSTDTLRIAVSANGKLYPKTPTLTVDGYHNTGEFSIGVLDCAVGTKTSFTDLPTVEFKRFENSVLNCTLTFSGASFTQYKSYALLPVGEFRFYLSADL